MPNSCSTLLKMFFSQVNTAREEIVRDMNGYISETGYITCFNPYSNDLGREFLFACHEEIQADNVKFGKPAIVSNVSTALTTMESLIRKDERSEGLHVLAYPSDVDINSRLLSLQVYDEKKFSMHSKMFKVGFEHF